MVDKSCYVAIQSGLYAEEADIYSLMQQIMKQDWHNPKENLPALILTDTGKRLRQDSKETAGIAGGEDAQKKRDGLKSQLESQETVQKMTPSASEDIVPSSTYLNC